MYRLNNHDHSLELYLFHYPFNLIMGLLLLLCPFNSSILLCIFKRARLISFCCDYLSPSWNLCIFVYYIVPSCWSMRIFLAMMVLALPFLGSGSIKDKAGDVPNILFLIYFLSLIKFPFSPSISDSKKMNLPWTLLWSNNF